MTRRGYEAATGWMTDDVHDHDLTSHVLLQPRLLDQHSAVGAHVIIPPGSNSAAAQPGKQASRCEVVAPGKVHHHPCNRHNRPPQSAITPSHFSQLV